MKAYGRPSPFPPAPRRDVDAGGLAHGAKRVSHVHRDGDQTPVFVQPSGKHRVVTGQGAEVAELLGGARGAHGVRGETIRQRRVRVGPPRGDHREGRLHGCPRVAGDHGDAAATGGEIGGGA